MRTNNSKKKVRPFLGIGVGVFECLSVACAANVASV